MIIDIDALIRAGIPLPQALGAAKAVYGEPFNPLLTLKALTFFGDGDLPTLAANVRQRLQRAVQAVDLNRIPAYAPQPGLIIGGREE